MILFCSLLLLQFNLKALAHDNATLPTSNSTEQRVDVAADALFDEYWQMYLMSYPEVATTLGDHRYDDRLTSYSLKCYEKRKVMMTEFLERASQLLPLADENTDTHSNIRRFVLMLQFNIERLMSGSHLFPVSVLSMPRISLRYILKYTKLDDAKDYWDLISRYKAFPEQIDEMIELMKEGMRTNFTLHEKSLWKMESDEENQIARDSSFFKPFLNTSLSSDDEYEIQQNASDALENYVFPALKKIDEFIETEYRNSSRPDIGVSSLPGGREYYHHELYRHLTDTGVTTDEIHALGVAEVERISKEMEEVIHSLGLNLTRQDFSDQLKNNESQFFQTGEEALDTYTNVIENVIAPKLPLIFKYIPDTPLNVDNVPSDFGTAIRAFYLNASPDNSTPGTFYLDTTSTKNLPIYEVMTLALHEALPGHHFQNSYFRERSNFPDCLKYGFNSNAFSEGWALYSEYLGYELGLYEDPYMRYGHLSDEMLRACRLVVDTGMHVFGWSRQRAIDYMMAYTAIPLESIEREVDRYITLPGQACAYKYGEVKIKRLRKKAEDALGDAFDVKEFHDIVLQNSGPLAIIEEQVNDYINRTSNEVRDD